MINNNKQELPFHDCQGVLDQHTYKPCQQSLCGSYAHRRHKKILLF